MQENIDQITTEEIMLSNTQELTKLEVILAAMYASASLFLSFLSKYEVPRMRLAEKAGELSSTEQAILHNFLDYIGNNWNGILMFLVAIAADRAISIPEEEVSKKETKKKISKIRECMPYLIFTIFFLANIDTETIKVLPWSFGEPMWQDIPAGVFGMLTAVLLFTQYKKTLGKKLDESVRRDHEKQRREKIMRKTSIQE